MSDSPGKIKIDTRVTVGLFKALELVCNNSDLKYIGIIPPVAHNTSEESTLTILISSDVCLYPEDTPPKAPAVIMINRQAIDNEDDLDDGVDLPVISSYTAGIKYMRFNGRAIDYVRGNFEFIEFETNETEKEFSELEAKETRKERERERG